MRVYVEAYGCSQNQGEAEELGRLAIRAGHVLTSEPSSADVGVLVSCAVIGPTEDRMVERWRELTRTVPHTIVTGCMVPLRRSRFVGPPPRGTTHFLPLRDEAELPRLLESLSGPSPRSVSVEDRASRGRAVHREVTLNQGCASACSYCFSRLARGRLASRSLPEVLSRVSEALEEGVVEIRLSSLDTSCWGAEGGPDAPRLPRLVEALGSLAAAREFKFRVGMMSPQTLRPIAVDYFRAIAANPRAFRFLHLPVQSGSDRVLAGMRRGYTVEEFRRLVQLARETLPELVLATDIITGFPGETVEDHAASLRLLEELEPEIVNVTRFSARPLTPAARWTPLPGRVVKERSRALTALRLRQARRRMERWVGRTELGLVTEMAEGGARLARLSNYLPVLLPQGPDPGSWVEVQIHGARSTYLVGVPLGPGRAPLPP